MAKLAVQGAKGADLRSNDFSRVTPTYMYDLTYDTQTRWPGPAKLPEGFDPARALVWATDPGLGLRALHTKGIDGRGMAVAVFDKPIRQSHQEFAGRIHYREVFPEDPKNKTYHFHGAAAASVLAGKNVGVAPGATLYYFAVPDNGENMSNYAVAMEELLEVSISDES
ncbi:MAG TPA: S8 family serine peptidase [Symbiobacteriaceae bacterium]|nr:S8 family serine peptidase [Symbiobacteriaceae bacterium]